jgi:hypothetical protein
MSIASEAPGRPAWSERSGAGNHENHELHEVACRELAEVCGVLNAGHGRMVRLVADVLAAGAWSGVGVHSPHQWLMWKASLSRQAASAVINLAKRSTELAATARALCEGWISLETAGLIARYVPAEYEASVLEVASVLTVRQLRRSVSRYHFDFEHPRPAPDGAAPGSSNDTVDGGSGPVGMQGGRLVRPSGEPVEERSEISMGSTDGGQWRASINLPPDLGATFEAALNARRHELYRRAEEELDPNDPRPRITLVDALMSIMEGSLRESDAAMPGTDRYLVHAHLVAAPGGGNALDLHLGATLPHHLRRLYMCDGKIRPVLETDGIPANVGRNQRIVSRRLRRLIEHRDGGCSVPGCGRVRGLEVHHVVHWEDGGLTTTDNLLTLCRRHHRMHHLGQLQIHGNADGPRHTPSGVRFADSRGRPLEPVGVPVAPPSDEPLVDSAARLGIDPEGFESALGERADYSQIFFSPSRPAGDSPSPGRSGGDLSAGGSRPPLRARRSPRQGPPP